MRISKARTDHGSYFIRAPLSVTRPRPVSACETAFERDREHVLSLPGQ